MLFSDWQATTQPLSFYEVVWNEPGERMVVRDVLIGGETEVIERSGSRTLRPGDLLFAQIWHQPELAVFGSMAPLAIPPDKKVEVIDLRKKLKKRMARQNRYLTPHDLLRYADPIRATYLGIRNALHTPPRLCNTDGDPFLFHTLTFRIESAEAAFEALASLAVGRSREELFDDAELDEGGKLRSVDFDWIREGNRKFKSWDNTILGHIKISAKRLIAEVNSENRAKRLRQEIEKRLGSPAVHESTIAQTLEEMRYAAARGRGGGIVRSRIGDAAGRSGSQAIPTAKKPSKLCFCSGSGTMKKIYLRIRFAPTSARSAAC